MKIQSDTERLLDDVLGDSIPPEFQAELLHETLRQVRRRRRVRQCSQGLLAILLISALPLLVWRNQPPAKIEIVQAPPPAFGVVRSQPLAQSMIVETRWESAQFITSSKEHLAVIETGSAENLFREINDEQLFALAGGRPVALVRHDSRPAEFHVLNSDEANGFPVP